MRTIRVMADFLSTGLWWGDVRSAGVDPTQLGLSGHTQRILSSWCSWYDKLDESAESYADIGLYYAEDDIEFLELGLYVSKLIKKDRPDLTVLLYAGAFKTLEGYSLDESGLYFVIT